MSKFICNCGKTFEDGEEPKGSCGLLKSLHAQVNLEDFQSKEISEFIELNESERKKWPQRHFGQEYPAEIDTKELIEDFLYSSHRRDGCSATFVCPSCGRFAVLHGVNEEWQFYVPESKA